MSRRRLCWISPLLTAAVLLSVYAFSGLYPFGSGTVSWCDMNQQVIPFLLDLRNICFGKADLFLNLENAGGMSFWGVFLFFVSSPFSFLVLLVPAEKIYLFVNILILLKMMTCAGTAELWLRRCFPALGGVQAAAAAVMYAFSGYAMCYYQNIVWLDVMALFPLLLIGLDRLVSQGKPLAYLLVLAAVLIVNFYLTYMVAVFLILGFAAYLLLCVPKEERGEKTLLFGCATLVSCLLTAVVWLPSFLQYLSSARTGSLISNLSAAISSMNFRTAVAVVLCTGAILAAILLALFSLSGRMSARIRWLFCMLVLTLIPVFVEPINRMWHAGSYQAFPVRYGYMPAMLGLTLFAWCADCYGSDLRSAAPPSGAAKILSSLGGGAVVCIAAADVYTILSSNFKEATTYTRTLWVESDSFRILLIFSVTFTFACMILMLIYRFGRLPRRVFSLFLCALAVTEGVFNCGIYLVSAKSDGNAYSSVFDLSGKTGSDSLSRVKLDSKLFDVNLLGALGYNSMSHYTSLTSKEYMYAMKKLGYSSYWMEVGSYGGTKLTDAILSNRWSVCSASSLAENANRVYSNSRFALVENSDWLPFGFVCSGLENFADLPDGTRFQTQETLFQTLFPTGETLFEEYEPDTLENVSLTETDHYELVLQKSGTEGTVGYTIPVSGTQTLYFDCFDTISNRLYEHINSSFSVSVNGKILDSLYPSQKSNGILCLGTFTDETVTVQIGVKRSVYAKSFGVAGLKDAVLSDALRKVSGASLRQSGNTISGTVSSASDGEYLFLPVSWAKGYSASVNGKPAEVLRVCDTFLAVRLEKGENAVSVAYVPQGFTPGLVLTLLGIPCACFFLRLVRSGAFGRAKKTQKVFRALFSVLAAAVFAAVYVFPLVVYFFL